MEVPKVQNSELTEDAKDEEITACKVPSKQDLETRYTEPIWARVQTCIKDRYYIEVILSFFALILKILLLIAFSSILMK